MKFIELWEVLDNIHPLWINLNGESEYFESKLDRGICAYANLAVEYITQDGEGVLTIELSVIPSPKESGR